MGSLENKFAQQRTLQEFLQKFLLTFHHTSALFAPYYVLVRLRWSESVPRMVFVCILLPKTYHFAIIFITNTLFNYIRTDVSTQERQQKTRRESYSHRVCQLILLTYCVSYKYFFKTSTLSSFSQGKSKSLRPKCP